MHAEQVQVKTEADAEKRKSMIDLANKFEASVQAVVGDVIRDANEMQGTAQGMSQTASQASDRSKAVAMASQEASANVQTVASAAEELSASISEITQRVGAGGPDCRQGGRRRPAHQRDRSRAGGRRAQDRRSHRPDQRHRRRRPICWRSTPPSKRRAPAKPARALPSSPAR